jgi:hypothetical protein
MNTLFDSLPATNQGVAHISILKCGIPQASPSSLRGSHRSTRVPLDKEKGVVKGKDILEFLHFQHHISSGLQLDLCQPRTLVRGAGFQTRENVPVHIPQGFSPGGGASNPTLRDADDQANSSGLSLKPALTGFSQM